MTYLLKAFPTKSNALLVGTGKDFIRRVGEEAARDAVLAILRGENLRTQTEFLTRARISQLNAALIAQYMTAKLGQKDFAKRFFDHVKESIKKENKKHPAYLTSQWFIGLNGKAVQNVLRGNAQNLEGYVARFEEVLGESRDQVAEALGEYKFSVQRQGTDTEERIDFEWEEFLRISTAIGAQTLTIRGSDKSMYGKLFERLVLGGVLTLLGFQFVQDPKKRNFRSAGKFWLSDSGDTREADATAVVSSGNIIRFDIGFIGPGNSEISKDKLTRFSAELERSEGRRVFSKTMVIVDRLPETNKTLKAAEAAGAQIVQMSMKFWPRELAMKLAAQGWESELATIPEGRVGKWLQSQLERVSLLPLVGALAVDATDD